jgi:hypothetical protein
MDPLDTDLRFVSFSTYILLLSSMQSTARQLLRATRSPLPLGRRCLQSESSPGACRTASHRSEPAGIRLES